MKNQRFIYKANWIFVVLLLTAVVFILIAAFQFVTGGGDPAQVSQARQKVLWAAVGVVLAVGARAIPEVVRSILGSTGTL